MALSPIRRASMCAQCSASFIQTGKGRPRARCYTCSPARPDQRTARQKPAGLCLGCKTVLPNALFKRCSPCNETYYSEYRRAYHRDRWPRWDRAPAKCEGCASNYTPHVPTQRYCSKPCRAKADSRRVSEARPLYRYARWKRLRRAQLEAEPSCRFCAAAGLERAATICDHVVPHRGDVQAFWAGPFQSLCVECHNRTKQAIEHRLAA